MKKVYGLRCYRLKRSMLSHVNSKDYAKILNYSAEGCMGNALAKQKTKNWDGGW